MNPHHLQLHLFDPARDQPETSPQIRQRLRPLLIMPLDEAVRGAQPVTEVNDE